MRVCVCVCVCMCERITVCMQHTKRIYILHSTLSITHVQEGIYMIFTCKMTMSWCKAKKNSLHAMCGCECHTRLTRVECVHATALLCKYKRDTCASARASEVDCMQAQCVCVCMYIVCMQHAKRIHSVLHPFHCARAWGEYDIISIWFLSDLYMICIWFAYDLYMIFLWFENDDFVP